MAELILTRLGAQLGAQIAGPSFAALGRRLGRSAGRAVGRAIDNRLSGADDSVRGLRMQELHLQRSSDGDPIAFVQGRMRLAGAVIWASRFKERRQSRSGGKGGPKIVDYRYSVSFAVALCEGVVNRVERAWANGKQFDLSTVAWRFYAGDETQTPDPTIEAIEGPDAAPAYRGIAYIVFEDFPLDDFGSTLPQLSFEVVRSPRAAGDSALETLVQGVCLIPGSGEFALASTPVRRQVSPGREANENTHAATGRANLAVALDQLQSDLPHCRSVLLVTSWFGDDLRCGTCTIRPRVERRVKKTRPMTWRVQGLNRSTALLVSERDGGPAFGGTPSDDSVIEAIVELKARGFSVGLYPFILMDIPRGNGKPDPYGGSEQAAYPWRGRITPTPARGQSGAADKTAAVASQMQAFFGSATPAHFGVAAGVVTYSGPNEWSYRRFILHYAALAQAAGGVNAFVIGSELREITVARSDASTFPAVAALRALAGDVRSVVGAPTKITYAADWSEYFGHQPADGTGDVYFHLDPLWADSNIDVIGLDWYAPLSDWRDGQHLDRSVATSICDPTYLSGNIEGGEGYDWYYASAANRAAQVRTPITDGTAGKPWVYRFKDLRNWWSTSHFNRPGGAESATRTAWVPQSKPIWFVEFGCPSIDKGSNAPNLFVDPKSSESGLPPFSSGDRDDMVQRRAIEAIVRYWQEPGRNPISSVYGGPMLDLSHAHVWAYDARPFPQFPALSSVWSDSSAWRVGHWLNGRAGATELAAAILGLCARAGVPAEQVDVSDVRGILSGLILDAPGSGMSALQPLMAAHDLELIESGGRLVFRHRTVTPVASLDPGTLIARSRRRGARDDAPDIVRVRYIDAGRDYRFGMVMARRLRGDRPTVFEVPLALDESQAEAIAQRALIDLEAALESFEADLPPSLLALEVGDVVTVEGEPGLYKFMERHHTRGLFVRIDDRASGSVAGADQIGSVDIEPDPAPEFEVFSAPPLIGHEDDDRPLAAVFAAPWRSQARLYAGADQASLSQVATVAEPAIMGELTSSLYPGPVGRWDRGNVLRVLLFGGVLASVPPSAVYEGENAFFVLRPDGGIELMQACECHLVGENAWELRTLLRGQQGTQTDVIAPIGSRLVRVDGTLARVDLAVSARHAPMIFDAPARGEPPGGAPDLLRARSVGDLWARPFSPAHLRARRQSGGDVALQWIRRARLGGDAWLTGEPPLGEDAERYRVEILDGASVKRVIEVNAPAATYPAASQISDFGAMPSSLHVRLAQWSARYGYGQARESVLWL